MSETSDASSNAQYELYLKCIRTPVIAIDSEYNVVYMNQYGRKLLGVKKNELQKQKVLRAF